MAIAPFEGVVEALLQMGTWNPESATGAARGLEGTVEVAATLSNALLAIGNSLDDRPEMAEVADGIRRLSKAAGDLMVLAIEVEADFTAKNAFWLGG